MGRRAEGLSRAAAAAGTSGAPSLSYSARVKPRGSEGPKSMTSVTLLRRKKTHDLEKVSKKKTTPSFHLSANHSDAFIIPPAQHFTFADSIYLSIYLSISLSIYLIHLFSFARSLYLSISMIISASESLCPPPFLSSLDGGRFDILFAFLCIPGLFSGRSSARLCPEPGEGRSARGDSCQDVKTCEPHGQPDIAGIFSAVSWQRLTRRHVFRCSQGNLFRRPAAT